MPKINYQVTTFVETEEVFHGMTLPVPRVLLYYLKHSELLVLMVILEETCANGICKLTIADMARRLHSCYHSIGYTLHQLDKQGLIITSSRQTRLGRKIRSIDYKTVQHLNDLVEGEDPAVFSKIRSVLKQKFKIRNITREDIEKTYDTRILPPEHDPEEEEEYD